MRLAPMTPSGMGNVLGVSAPVAVVDRNLTLINTRFGLAIAPTATNNADTAATALQAAFTAIAGALSLSLFPVAGSADPEAAVQANFELINAAW